MTEKEKMLSGAFYDANDPELIRDRLLAKTLLFRFNHTLPRQSGRRNRLLTRLLGYAPVSAYMEPPFYCDYGYNIRIGKNFYANHNCVILDVCEVLIGDGVMFGPGVQIYTAAHPVDPDQRLSGLEMGERIVIGDNVWIGGNTVICPGVVIGRNVTIGAGSVVTKSISDNVVAVGNPCKVIRELSGSGTIES